MSDAPLLNKQAVFLANDFHFDTLEVKEWNGHIRLRELSGEERSFCDKISADVQAGRGGANTYAAAIVACGVVDEQGNSVFSRQDVAALSKKSDAVLQRIAVKILQLSGATFEARQELEKN